MDDIGQFLFLLAFVIIAAIQWVIKQIQARNAPLEPEDDPLEETWNELEEQREDGRLREELRPSQVREEREPDRPPAANPLSELRNLFESLKQSEAPPKTAPPPLLRSPEIPTTAIHTTAVPPRPTSASVERKIRRDSIAGALSVEERAALKRLQHENDTAALRPKRRKANDGNFRKFLHGAGNLRQALILKEVFDRPLALRHESIQESLAD